MTAQLLYNDNDMNDAINVFTFIDKYTNNLGISPVVIDPGKVVGVVTGCKRDFPHDGGVQKASAFKQVANFVCHFIAARPLLEPFPIEVIKKDLAKIDNHQNAMVAFAIGATSINRSLIQLDDGHKEVAKPIVLSRHSYIDIIDAFANVSPVHHFNMAAVLFEQLTYKSNPECQYKTFPIGL